MKVDSARTKFSSGSETRVLNSTCRRFVDNTDDSPASNSTLWTGYGQEGDYTTHLERVERVRECASVFVRERESLSLSHEKCAV